MGFSTAVKATEALFTVPLYPVCNSALGLVFSYENLTLLFFMWASSNLSVQDKKEEP